MPSRRLRLVALMSCCLLSSCFTMGLWGFELEDERDPVTGERDSTFVYCEDTEWSFGLVIARLLATPLTLTLDCVTAPVQAFLWGDDDDDESPGQACK